MMEEQDKVALQIRDRELAEKCWEDYRNGRLVHAEKQKKHSKKSVQSGGRRRKKKKITAAEEEIASQQQSESIGVTWSRDEHDDDSVTRDSQVFMSRAEAAASPSRDFSFVSHYSRALPL